MLRCHECLGNFPREKLANLVFCRYLRFEVTVIQGLVQLCQILFVFERMKIVKLVLIEHILRPLHPHVH